MTQITGHYANGNSQWFVEVQHAASPPVLRAMASARNGYEADLGWRIAFAPMLYARFAHKQFRWGNAVSFLVQYQMEGDYEVPNNGSLIYEIHGVTKDHRYTVRAAFDIAHPQLAGSSVRTYHDDPAKADSQMRRDRDYLLVERCQDTSFLPSITSIDAMVNGLEPDVTR